MAGTMGIEPGEQLGLVDRQSFDGLGLRRCGRDGADDEQQAR